MCRLMTNRRRNIYWSIEIDRTASELAWKVKKSVSAFLSELVCREAKKSETAEQAPR